MKLFEYAIIYHPTKEQKKEGEKDKVVAGVTVAMAANEQTALLAAAKAIPVEYDDQLEQVEVMIRPF